MPNPVSYTHLDVYKRQTLLCVYRVMEINNKTENWTFEGMYTDLGRDVNRVRVQE